MFCGECGTKNEKDAKFCEKCGASLAGTKKSSEKKSDTTKTTVNNKEPEKKVEPKKVEEKKPLSKQAKIIIASSIAAFLILVVFISVGISSSSPKSVAKDYMKAYASNNYSKLYDYIKIDNNVDKTFVSKGVYTNINNANKDKDNDINNYVLGNINYGLGKITAEVEVKYTTNSSSNEKTGTIKLQKSGKKKMLFFDKWEVANSDVSTVKDYKLSVPKDSKVEFAGIKLSNKYLDKDSSTSSTDVYVLKQVFTLSTPIKVTLKNGIVIEDKDKPSTYYNSHTIRLSSSNISSKMKSDLTKKAKEDLTEMYKGFIEGKKFADLNSKLFNKNLESSYDSYLSSIQSSSRKLTKLEVTGVDYSSMYATSDNYLRVYVKMKYNYSISYKSGEEDKTKDSNSSDGVYLTYELKGNSYELREVSSLPTYFSIYY